MNRFLILSLIAICIMSCGKTESQKSKSLDIKFKRVLILGNSITYHEENSSLGWAGNWGMAASTRDSDYVHILKANFIKNKSNAVFKTLNISEFENEYSTYNLNKLDSLKRFEPDLLILRIGENVNVNLITVNNFSKRYLDLILYFKSTNPNLKIICVSSFWRNPVVEDIMRQGAISENAAYVSLSHLDEERFTAWGLFSVPAVSSHPGNRGMKEIAGLIWNKIIEINN